jgi:hypothetical protein
MGQAKQRGTEIERKRLAIEAKKFMPLDVGSQQWSYRKKVAEKFVSAVLDVANTKGLDERVTRPFNVLLHYMWECEYRGACHSTSAILFVLLSELGLDPKLCIGEVRAGNPYFDHSWIELDSEIFDIAVSLPELIGENVGGPVFASIDLLSVENTSLIFGISDGEGLGEDARIPFENTLNGYAEAQRREDDSSPDIWQSIVYLAPQVGLALTESDLIAKYGNMGREYRSGVKSDVKCF